MNSKKLSLLSPIGVALLIGTSLLVTSFSSTALGQQQQQPNSGGNQDTTLTITINDTATTTADTLNCDMAASVL